MTYWILECGAGGLGQSWPATSTGRVSGDTGHLVQEPWKGSTSQEGSREAWGRVQALLLVLSVFPDGTFGLCDS